MLTGKPIGLGDEGVKQFVVEERFDDFAASGVGGEPRIDRTPLLDNPYVNGELSSAFQ